MTMEYQKKLLYNTPNQPSKFRTKNLIEINDDSCGTYSTIKQIKFKTSILSQVYVIKVMHTYLVYEPRR